MQAFQTNFEPVELSETDHLESRRRYKVLGIKGSSQENTSVQCIVTEQISSIELQLPDEQLLHLQGCTPRCLFTASRKNVCENTSIQKEYDARFTFWSYLVVRVLVCKYFK